jgi:hypothetical protein
MCESDAHRTAAAGSLGRVGLADVDLLAAPATKRRVPFLLNLAEEAKAAMKN